MLDVANLTLDEIDAEYGLTLDKLERLSKLREAVSAQNYRRIKNLVEEYNTMKKVGKTMGRKWAKAGLTSDDVLYIAEEVDPKDAQRLEIKMQDPKEKEKIEKRLDDLIVALGAKWG